MSNLKKILIVFLTLLIFIIIVEQPGHNNSKKNKNGKFFIPKMVIDDVKKIGIQKPGTKEVILDKNNDTWQVKDGRYFPADKKRMNDFLKMIYNLKEGEVVSKNPNRMSIYAVDDKTGINIRIWDNKQNKIADFFVGKYNKKGQFIRRDNESLVFYNQTNMTSFLFDGSDSWKDKVVISLKEDDVSKITLKNNEKEVFLEKFKAGEWNVVKPEKYKANKTAVSNLFNQLEKLEAKSFASVIDGNKANFKEPDYQLILSFDNNSSLQTILFSAKDAEKKEYYAKKNSSDLIYIISKNVIDKIFDANFKSAP